MSEYIPSPKGLPKGAHALPSFEHGGKIIEVYKARCHCGYCGPLRDYPYEATEDILNHFRRVKTLMEENGDGREFSIFVTNPP